MLPFQGGMGKGLQNPGHIRQAGPVAADHHAQFRGVVHVDLFIACSGHQVTDHLGKDHFLPQYVRRPGDEGIAVQRELEVYIGVIEAALVGVLPCRRVFQIIPGEQIVEQPFDVDVFFHVDPFSSLDRR